MINKIKYIYESIFVYVLWLIGERSTIFFLFKLLRKMALDDVRVNVSSMTSTVGGGLLAVYGGTPVTVKDTQSMSLHSG